MSEDEMSEKEARETRRPDAAVNDDGVDRTLIRWFRGLTPLERLRTVERYIASVEKVRDGRQYS